MRKLSHQEIVSRQRSKNQFPKLPFCAVLNNIRSLYNVGSIFRTADGAGVQKIYTCGITGHPPNPQIAKTALGAEVTVPWEYEQDAVSVIKQLKRKNYQIILLEQIEGAIAHDEFKPNPPVCLVLGNEIGGVSPEIIDLCDQAVEIEMLGLKNSLNVSVAFGVIAYHMRGHLKSPV